MTLEEVELHLEDNSEDLTVWRHYLSLCRRFNIPQEKYFKYLQSKNILIQHPTNTFLTLSNIDDLYILNGMSFPDLYTLVIRGPHLKSTKGLENLIFHCLNMLVIENMINLEISNIVEGYDSAYSKNQATDIDNVLGLKIQNSTVVFNSTPFNLTDICIVNSKITGLTIKDLYNLKTIWIDDINILKTLGNSDFLKRIDYNFTQTVQTLNFIRSLEYLIDRGWYPYLEYPVKGINVR